MNSSLNKRYLKHEKLQVFLRLSVTLFIFLDILYIYFIDYESNLRLVLEILPAVFALALLNWYVVEKHPDFFQYPRIVLFTLLDVFFVSSVIYLVYDVAAYYPFFLLWFIVGYGMRYGLRIGYIAYISVLVSWGIILYGDTFWHEHLDVGLGWLIAYGIIPLYFFKLVKELHSHIFALHKEVDISEYQAMHDALTGLPNRLYFEKELQKNIDIADKTGAKIALLFIDLDGFKAINDTYGHQQGDKILIELAKRISLDEIFSSRLGGDEFVSMFTFEKVEELQYRLKKLCKSVHTAYQANQKIVFAASIGISIYPDDAKNAHELKKHADIAMYRAKDSGKDRYCFYEKQEIL